jgi:hypothetical protein
VRGAHADLEAQPKRKKRKKGRSVDIMKYSFGYGKKQQEITKFLNRSKLGDEFYF